MKMPETERRAVRLLAPGTLALTFIIGGLCGWGFASLMPPPGAHRVCDECGGDGEDGVAYLSWVVESPLSETCKACGGDGIQP